jgi:hypothetical protein
MLNIFLQTKNQMIHNISILNKHDNNTFVWQGKEYQAYGNTRDLFRSGDYLIYKKCLNLKFDDRDNQNICNKYNIYANNDKIDEYENKNPEDVLKKQDDFMFIEFIQYPLVYYAKKLDSNYLFTYNLETKEKKLTSIEWPPIGLINDKPIYYDDLKKEKEGDIGSSLIISNDIYYLYEKESKYNNKDDFVLLMKNDLKIKYMDNFSIFGSLINGKEESCVFEALFLSQAKDEICIFKNDIIVNHYNNDEYNYKIDINENSISFASMIYDLNTATYDNHIDDYSFKSLGFLFDENENLNAFIIHSHNNLYFAKYAPNESIYEIGELQLLFNNVDDFYGAVKK